MRTHHSWDWANVHRLALKETRGILGPGPDAEDAAQEAAIRAWRRRATCRDAPGAWIRAIAHNEALRVIGRRRAEAPERHEWNAGDADGRPLPHDQLPVEITRLTGRECSDVEIGLPDADGAVRWLRISTRRVDDVPPPCTVIGSFADVTEERHTRE